MKNVLSLLLLGAAGAPLTAHAQSAQEYIVDVYVFINDVLLPLLIAAAIFFFIWNAFRYFILEGATDEGRENAKRLALWGILAVVLMLIIWGIVVLLADAFGFLGAAPICPDYLTAAQCGNSAPSGFFSSIFGLPGEVFFEF